MNGTLNARRVLLEQILWRRSAYVHVVGPVGAGKTEWLAELAAEGRARGLDVAQVDAGTLLTGFVERIRAKAPPFIQLPQPGGLLTVDDAHTLAGMSVAQEEFHRAFVRQLEGQSRIVLASTDPSCLDLMVSPRHPGPEVMELPSLTAEDRVEVVLRHAERHGAPMSRSEAEDLVEHHGECVDLRDLVGDVVWRSFVRTC